MSVQIIRFEALGRSRTFKFGFQAICRLEARFDRPFGEIIGDMLPGLDPSILDDPARLAAAAGQMRFDHLGALIQAGLDDGTATDADVAELIDELGFDRALGIIFGAAANDLPAMPESPGAGKKKGAARSPRRSTATR
jgi:hypothetical protein